MSVPTQQAAIDSNVLNALLRYEPNAAQIAALLDQFKRTHGLMICPVVYAELLAGPGATVLILQRLLTASCVLLDLGLPLAV